MQPLESPLCSLDNTWEDVMGEFKETLKGTGTWSLQCIDGVDREVLLSAPEIMDPKTDCGFGYQDIPSLQHLIDTKAIPAASTLTDEAKLLDVMDLIFAKELLYFQGYALVQSYLAFPYFLRMELLKAQNPTLHVYCRGVLRTLDYVLRAVYGTTVRTDEEFSMAPPELDREEAAPLEEILAELETAAANISARSPAVASRLRFRKHLLAALSLFLEAKCRSDVEAACGLCDEAVALLDGDTFTSRKAEPQVESGFMREKEVAYWVSAVMPTKQIDTPKFSDAVAAYKTALMQLVSLRKLLTLQSLSAIVEFVEAFGAQQPLLPTRSVAVVVLFNQDANVSFLFGSPIQQRLLEMLAKDYGSPLYLKVYEGNDSMIESVVKYRIHKTTDPTKVTPQQLMAMRQQTVDAVRRWAMEACKQLLMHMETMLCNRGLAHRRLMKGMAELASFQEMSFSTDMSVFLASEPGVVGDRREDCVRASTVLSLFASSMVLRAMELTVQLELELDLLTQGELVPALWYYNFTQRAQTESLSLLCLQNTSFIPEKRVNKKTLLPLHNLALSTRTAGRVDATRVSVLDASRMLTDSVFISACLMEHKGLIDLTSAAKHSLVTVEDAFNHRMHKCFGAVQSPPFFPYHRCIASKPNFAADEPRVPEYAKKAGAVATKAAGTMKAMLTSSTTAVAAAGSGDSVAEEEVRRECVAASYGGFEKAAKTVSASLVSLSALCEDADRLGKYEATVDRSTLPYTVNFALRKKE